MVVGSFSILSNFILGLALPNLYYCLPGKSFKTLAVNWLRFSSTLMTKWIIFFPFKRHTLEILKNIAKRNAYLWSSKPCFPDSIRNKLWKLILQLEYCQESFLNRTIKQSLIKKHKYIESITCLTFTGIQSKLLPRICTILFTTKLKITGVCTDNFNWVAIKNLMITHSNSKCLIYWFRHTWIFKHNVNF